MCGICGFYGKNKYDETLLLRMADSISYRGPDDRGGECYVTSSGNQVGMGHRRLSIMDLSSAGHQPMSAGDGKAIIVYNGEIYNFKEIREELEARGIKFFTRCDTEVVLKAYLEYGTDCFEHFNGMFAIAIYDRDSDRIILARDRIGVKPLYYYVGADSFVWGSELKPVMLHPEFRKELRTDVLSRYFCHDYIKSPDTIFKDTYKVEPGEYIIWHSGNIEKVTYWNHVDRYHTGLESLYSSYEEAKESVISLTEDAVRRRMVADVEVGTFLSGGIDSTLVTAIAQKYSSVPVRTYTIGFETKEENEAVYAKEVAERLGTDHTELYIGEKELFEMLKDMPVYYDEPFADQSQLPSMLVSRLASADVKVVLSGDGGDELYCGYPMYDWIRKAQRLDTMGALAYHTPGRKLWGRKLPNIVNSFIDNRDPDLKAQFVETAKQKAMKGLLVNRFMDPKYEMEGIIGEKDWVIRRMLIDMRSYLPDNNLCKMDRASMKYSIEARNPLVDYRLVENSFKIPLEYKYFKGDKKHILKDITYGYVDRELLERPKKGFGVPLRLWLTTYLKDELNRYADPRILKKQELFDPGYVRNLIDDMNRSDKTIYSTLTWNFYVFERWYKEYIEDLWD